MNKKNGFTLAELMLVVAILGILLSVVLPRMTGRTKEARTQAARLQMENISIALDTFEYDCGRYPTAQEGLEALHQQPSGLNHWKGPYMKQESGLLDPWKKPYIYSSPGKAAAYEVSSLGRDGQTGGTGEDADIVNGNK